MAVIFAIFNKWWGLAALLGGVLHLAQDAAGFVPWLYPFKSYVFPEARFDLWRNYVSIFGLGADILGLGLLAYLVFVSRAALAAALRGWRHRLSRLA